MSSACKFGVPVRSRKRRTDVPLQAPADGRDSPDPPTYRSSTLNWRRGDTIPLTAERTLRVLGVRDDDADQPPVLVVEDMPGSASSAAS